jgi:AAA family ATP:ADP antiporter
LAAANGGSRLDRILRLFTDVRSGEGTMVLLLAVNMFLLLMAYYFIKPVREALILTGAGAEVKSYAAAGQTLLLLGAVPLYGLLTNRLPRRRLINTVTVFFAACLVVFYVAATLHASPGVLGVTFYLWVGIFNLMVIAQFWSFANDIYTLEEGERLFPVVAFGASFGGFAGAFIAGLFIEPLGVNQLMLLAAGLLLLSLVITNYADAETRRRKEADLPNILTTGSLAASQQIRLDEFRKALEASEAGESREVTVEVTGRLEAERGKGPGPFAMVLRCRYLLLIGLLMLLTNWVNTNGEYLLGRVVESAADTAVAAGTTGGLSAEDWIGNFYSNFFTGVNLLGMFLQLFVVSRVIKYFGIRIALLILPIIALGAYALIALYPILHYVRMAKTAENATDYSLQNTVRNILFLPTTREQKYKAKQAIDTFFVRLGDLLSAGVVFVGTTVLAMTTAHFALVNVALVFVWLVIAVRIGLEYKTLVTEGRPPC